jgi:hypothetical protein
MPTPTSTNGTDTSMSNSHRPNRPSILHPPQSALPPNDWRISCRPTLPAATPLYSTTLRSQTLCYKPLGRGRLQGRAGHRRADWADMRLGWRLRSCVRRAQSQKKRTTGRKQQRSRSTDASIHLATSAANPRQKLGTEEGRPATATRMLLTPLPRRGRPPESNHRRQSGKA